MSSLVSDFVAVSAVAATGLAAGFGAGLGTHGGLLCGAQRVIGLTQFVNSDKGNPNALIVTGAVMVGAIETNHPPVTLKNATPIARLFADTMVITVPASSPIKSLKDLTIAETAMLAGLPQSPYRANPITNLKLAQRRQSTVLMRMAPGASLPDHEHVLIEQTWVLEGHLVDRDGPDVGMECKAGQFIWRPAGSRHSAWAPKGGTFLAIFQIPNKFFDQADRVSDISGQDWDELWGHLPIPS